jgi:protein-tyrosine phosphatase
MKKASVLMVCRHNICRSPMAEGLLKYYLKEKGLDKVIKVDSAGTHGDMVGVRVDERAGKVALKFGIDLKRKKSRQIKPKDYLKFDYILAMDQANYQMLLENSPVESIEKIALVMSYAPDQDSLDVPDPYYGSIVGFEEVFSLLDSAVGGLVKKWI